MTIPSDELSNTTHSSSFALLAESYFLSELLQEMWFRRSQLVDVLHSRVDAFGYDLVLTTDTVTRHVQLKTRRKGARTSRYDLNAQLEELPSACAILMEWAPPVDDPPFQVGYRWFGGEPGERMPSLGGKLAKHTKANAAGNKSLRPQIRTISTAKLKPVDSMTELATKLFGRP